MWCSLLLQSSSNNEAHSLFLVCSSAVLCVFLAALLDDLLSLDVHEQKNAEETCLLHFFSFLIHTITVLFKSIPYNKPRHTQYIRFFNQKKNVFVLSLGTSQYKRLWPLHRILPHGVEVESDEWLSLSFPYPLLYRIKMLLHPKGKARCLKITEKVSFNIASEASYVYILSGQKLIKNAQNGPFWRVFENLKLAVKQCYQTGQF